MYYHYTSAENYAKIREDGLQPYLISKGELIAVTGRSIMGIWLWTRKPKKRNHLGNILRVLGMHNTTRVMFLEVDVPESQMFQHQGRKVILKHAGQIGNFVYHKNFPAQIGVKSIPPNCITLLTSYDLLDMVRSNAIIQTF